MSKATVGLKQVSKEKKECEFEFHCRLSHAVSWFFPQSYDKNEIEIKIEILL